MRTVPISVAALSLLLSITTALAQSSPAPAPMKAIVYHTQGGPEVLKYEDAPRPSPREGELLVRVRAAGVNPVDAKVRSGGFGPGGKFPAIPGYDLAGVVEERGPGATRFKKGDEVFAYLNLRRGGAYAQYALVKEDEVAAKPSKASFEEAAAVPLAALTAWQALVETAKLEPGQTVLIHGGSGGVGSFAIQIARARGAKVIATASTRNQQTLKDLGADQAIDYTTTKFEDVAKEVDVVLDTVAGETLARSYGVLKKGGIVVSILEPPNKDELSKREVRGQVILVRPHSGMLAEIGKLIDAGKIKPVVSQVLPLAEAAKAPTDRNRPHPRQDCAQSRLTATFTSRSRGRRSACRKARAEPGDPAPQSHSVLGRRQTFA